ncbi:MAG: pentapeptide repeat-containing protein [Filomicrobium sp.]
MTLGNAGWLRVTLAACILGVSVFAAGQSAANDLTAREVTIKLFDAEPDKPVDFSDLNLTLIDLSGLDFKRAVLTGADLYGTDFSNADLTGTDLSYTRLDRATIIGTNFTEADLTESSFLRPTTHTDTRINRSETADFTRAKLVRTRLFARLDGASFRSADLTEADFSPLSSGANTIAVLPYVTIVGADFSNAILKGANLQQGKLSYSNFRNADLREVDFRAAELTGVNFAGANVAGADFTGASMDRAILSGVIGLNQAKGLGVAVKPGDEGIKRP